MTWAVLISVSILPSITWVCAAGFSQGPSLCVTGPVPPCPSSSLEPPQLTSPLTQRTHVLEDPPSCSLLDVSCCLWKGRIPGWEQGGRSEYTVFSGPALTYLLIHHCLTEVLLGLGFPSFVHCPLCPTIPHLKPVADQHSRRNTQGALVNGGAEEAAREVTRVPSLGSQEWNPGECRPWGGIAL